MQTPISKTYHKSRDKSSQICLFDTKSGPVTATGGQKPVKTTYSQRRSVELFGDARGSLRESWLQSGCEGVFGGLDGAVHLWVGFWVVLHYRGRSGGSECPLSLFLLFPWLQRVTAHVVMRSELAVIVK